MHVITDILEHTERVVAVQAVDALSGVNLQLNGDGTGFIGNYLLESERYVDTLVIYHQQKDQASIYKAKLVLIEKLRAPEQENLYKLHFKNCNDLGSTDQGWPQFSKGSTQAVCYFNT